MNIFVRGLRKFLQMEDVSITSPANGQVPTYNSGTGKWENATPSGGLSSIADQRVLGNVSGGVAVPTALTPTQIRTLLALADIATSGSASDLGTGTLNIARLADASITGAKLATEYLPKNNDPGVSSFTVGHQLLFYNGTLISSLTGPTAARLRLASNASGDVAWRAESAPLLAGTTRDLHLLTSNPVAWKSTPVDIDIGSRLLAAETLTSGEGSLQTFTLRSGFLRVPDGFLTFKTTGAFSFSLLADDTSSANAVLTGYTVTGYTDREGTATTLVTASGLTTAVTTASVPDVVSVDRSAFVATTVPAWIVVEFDLSVRSSKCVSVVEFNLASE